MQNYDNPIPRKEKGAKLATQKRKIKSVETTAAEKGITYGINSLNLNGTTHVNNESVWGK